MPGAAVSAWRAASGHCSECDRVVVSVRPLFSLARPALWAGVLAGGPGHVCSFGPLAGPGVHSPAELQGGSSGLRSWSHGRECWLEPGVPHPVGRRFCLFPRRPVGGVLPGTASGLIVHLVDVRLSGLGLAFSRPWGCSTTIRFFVLLMADVDAVDAPAGPGTSLRRPREPMPLGSP